MVKEKFLTIYKDASEKAESEFEKSILPILDKLSNYEKIKFLQEKRTEISTAEAAITVTPYLKNASSEDWLLKLFASRFTILNADDTEELGKAVYLGILANKINTKYTGLKNDIPSYTYDDFLKGIQDPILFELNYVYHLKDKEDFFNIRHWQAEQVIKVVSYEATQLINLLLKSLRENPSYKTTLQSDITIYDQHLANHSNLNPQELMRHLSALSFLSSYNFDEIDANQWLRDHKLFTDGVLQWSRVTPVTINQSRERLNRIKLVPFSDTPFIFFTIHQTIKWVKVILGGGVIVDTFSHPDYSVLAKSTMEEAQHEADLRIKQFNTHFNLNSHTKEDLERACIQKLETLRHKFNASDEIVKEYFASIQKGDNTENLFQLNAFFFDLDQQIDFLKEAYLLDILIHYFIASCRELGGKNRVEYPGIDDGSSVSEIMYLAHNMVLDNDLHQKLSEILDEFMIYTTAYCMPFDIALQNVRESMHQLFIECIDRLLGYLEDADPINKVMYIQTRLKQLKQREIGLNQLSTADLNNMQPKYTSLLREYLEIEAEFIKETKDISFFQQPIKIHKLNSAKNNIELIKTPLSFGYKASKEGLRKLIHELNSQIYLLRDDVNAVENLVTLLTSDDLTTETERVIFNCETTQLYYIFNKLKPYFLDLSFKNIEKSQLFFTKNGNPLKAQNLSASKVDFPKNYKEIDKAFALFQ